MPTKNPRTGPTLLAASLLALTLNPPLPAREASLYWDVDDTTANADGGSGQWDVEKAKWSTAATAGSATVWANDTTDIAVFGGSVGNVELVTGITVGGLQFDTAGYTLEGTGANTLTFGTSGNIVANAAATISAVIADNAGTQITKTGRGTLTLSGNNTYTGGTTISAGTLATGVVSGLGVGTGTTTIASGANLNLTGGGLTYTGLSTVAGAGTINITLDPTGTIHTVFDTDFTRFTGVINVGVDTAVGAHKAVVISSAGSRDNADMRFYVNNHATLSVHGLKIADSGPWRASVMLYGGDTAESLGQLRVDYLANWAGGITLAGTITGIDDGFIGCQGTGGTGGTISGVISEIGGPRVLSKAGGGTLTLSGANTYTGATEIYGNLIVASLNSVSTNEGLGTTPTASSNLGAPGTVADGTISLGKTTKVGQLTYIGSGETTDRVLNLAGTTGGGTLDQSGTGLLKFTSSLTATGVGAKMLTLQGSTAGTGELAGVIVDSSSGATSLTKTGTGTWTLSGANTYTGATEILGNLKVSSLNSVTTDGGLGTTHTASSNLGAPGTVADGTISLGKTNSVGQLTYTGNGETTDRVLNLAGTTGGGTLDQSGTGLLKFTSSLTATGVGAKMLTLQGSTAGTGELAGVIGNSSSGATSLTKTGTGTWTLSGANTYTGGTFIKEGSISLGSGNDRLPTGSVVTLGDTSTKGTLILGNNGTPRNQTLGGLSSAGLGGNVIGQGAGSTLTVNMSGQSTFAGVLGGTGPNNNNLRLIKQGNGALTLSGSNTYTGATSLNRGTLVVSGSLANTTVTVANGATLVVSGSLANTPVTVANGATLAGTGRIGGNVTIQNGGHQAFVVATTSAAQPTRTISGKLELSPGHVIDLTSSATPAAGTYTLVTATEGISGTVGTVNLTGLTGTVSLVGNSLVLTVTAANDYDAWKSANGLVGGQNDDDDHDGMINFGEYAFGLNPNSAASVNPVSGLINTETGFSFNYTRRKPSLSKVTCTHEYSTTLASDSWNTFESDSVTTNGGDPIEEVAVKIPAALLTNPKLFLRVRATQ